MPITLQQAKNLKRGTTLYSTVHRNRDGSPLRARVNGTPETWKTRPGEVRVPMKHGLRNTFQIWHYDLQDWCFTEDEVIQYRRDRAVAKEAHLEQGPSDLVF